MFGKKESKTNVGVVSVVEKRGKFDGMETVIGNNTIIKGEIDSTGTVRIDGRVEGKIKTDGDVIIGGDGEVKADIFSKNVVIGGKVEGNIEAKDRLEVSSTGK
ncbi:MAG: polymer-forming cytoskeletal protein, partial [Synergistetes bacterium]|nr:polymer-forming cytoskeletal protein [Synergistota bacterium]